jgi:hypothetical protein
MIFFSGNIKNKFLGPIFGSGSNENMLKISQNHEKYKGSPHFCIEKQINKYMNLSSERSMSTSDLEPLRKPKLHHKNSKKLCNITEDRT